MTPLHAHEVGNLQVYGWRWLEKILIRHTHKFFRYRSMTRAWGFALTNFRTCHRWQFLTIEPAGVAKAWIRNKHGCSTMAIPAPYTSHNWERHKVESTTLCKSQTLPVCSQSRKLLFLLILQVFDNISGYVCTCTTSNDTQRLQIRLNTTLFFV